ncbi:MAG: tyrosine-type recombinase/integrase [Theionarchaea archaeon]|nr:tyrosine-type recombinase/integrase [Theionarchaea archaeon]
MIADETVTETDFTWSGSTVNVDMQNAVYSLENFEVYLITHKQISSGVARNYFYSVRKFLRWVNTDNPTEADAMQYYQYLQGQGYANSTVANIVYALNRYFQFLGKKIKLTPPKRHNRQPNFLTVEEAQALLRVIPNLRDRAIVTTLLYTGMRVNELCNLDMSDLHLDKREITVRDTKTYHDRKVIISEKCVCALTQYLDSLPNERKAVFTSQKGGPISRGRVYAMVKKYGQLAGITKNVTPHVLRHTLATNMIAHGASVIEVKEQLGHRNIETTLKYIHLQIGQRKKLYNEHCPKF